MPHLLRCAVQIVTDDAAASEVLEADEFDAATQDRCGCWQTHPHPRQAAGPVLSELLDASAWQLATWHFRLGRVAVHWGQLCCLCRAGPSWPLGGPSLSGRAEAILFGCLMCCCSIHYARETVSRAVDAAASQVRLLNHLTCCFSAAAPAPYCCGLLLQPAVLSRMLHPVPASNAAAAALLINPAAVLLCAAGGLRHCCAMERAAHTPKSPMYHCCTLSFFPAGGPLQDLLQGAGARRRCLG